MQPAERVQAARQQLRTATQEIQTASVQVEYALNSPVSQQMEQLEKLRTNMESSFATARAAVVTMEECAAEIREQAFKARM